ncbi:hypothetical protein TTHERM_000698687 (macronuclear) [Tetrahymena thermophila SB210]|uniref:Uncharacterized protein n=1 Tax=Tetrahymena thermophila (strain SB210) TaxID=312017 RepID=W7XKP4_TETTS|nr:hypothetical protein TTHERM_000698687 [Tetrahymena thermophila SB210]EWS76696.1 hypothetical protein TTHERM_000698687 [Tetrahymena thermophila SB210]|eukprot:XP_012650766.1 hypothetical protein TTHERM_000698687 [Tetrahymena thermophila SB210]
MQTERQNGKLQIRNEQFYLKTAFMQINKIIFVYDWLIDTQTDFEESLIRNSFQYQRLT